MIYSLAITGPTASGKTAVSVELAKAFRAEIISCDSMQIYKGMDIGTAKATTEEQDTVPHHMLDVVSPTEDYSVESYRRDALACAGDIISRGSIPIFVGGTGLYIDALMRAPMKCVPESSREYRDAELSKIKTEDDKDALWERLRRIDPESAFAIHKNNVRRVLRAIEIYETTGKTKSYFDALSRAASPDIHVDMITLDFHNRDNLYRRVDMRVDEMLGLGLVDEVRSLYLGGLLLPGTTASQAIGYKEIVSYLDGESSLEEACDLIKLSTRRYAKRQLTWFRHETCAYRLYIDNEDGSMRGREEIIREAIAAAEQFIKGFSK